MRFTRIYADESGETHFDDVEMPLQSHIPAPGLRPVRASPRITIRHAQFLIANPASVDGDWHPAPARQFALFLRGSLDVDVSDGEGRRFGPGSFLFLEDTWGKGHRNRAVDDDDILWVFLPVPDDLIIQSLLQP